jgi:hypothetical protein
MSEPKHQDSSQTTDKVGSRIQSLLPLQVQLELTRFKHAVIQPMSYPAQSQYTISVTRSATQTTKLRQNVLSPILDFVKHLYRVLNWEKPAQSVMWMTIYLSSVFTATTLPVMLFFTSAWWIHNWAQRNPKVVKINVPQTAQDVAAVLAEPLIATSQLDQQGNASSESWSDYFGWSKVANGDFAYDLTVEVLDGLSRKWKSPWTLAILGALFATSWFPVRLGILSFEVLLGIFGFVFLPIFNRSPRFRESTYKTFLKNTGGEMPNWTFPFVPRKTPTPAQLSEHARRIPIVEVSHAQRSSFTDCPVGGFHGSSELRLEDESDVARWIDTDSLLGAWACTKIEVWKRGVLALTNRHLMFVDRRGNLMIRAPLNSLQVSHASFPLRDGIVIKVGDENATFAGFETKELSGPVFSHIQAAKAALEPIDSGNKEWQINVISPKGVPADSLLKPTQIMYTIVSTHGHFKHTAARTWSEFVSLQSAVSGEASGTNLQEDSLVMEKFDTALVTNRSNEMEKCLLQVVSLPNIRQDHRVQAFLGMERED